MSKKSFSYSEVLGFGWRVMKSNFWFFAGVIIVASLISLSGQIAGQIMRSFLVVSPFLFFTMLGVSLIIQVIVGIGLIKITLSFCDSQKPGFGTLFSGFDCFWRYIATAILYVLIIGGIPALFVAALAFLSRSYEILRKPFFFVPFLAVLLILMISLSVKFCLCFYFVIDKKLGPIKALKASGRATEGARLSLFIFFILCGLINSVGHFCIGAGVFTKMLTIVILGVICIIAALFITWPTVMVATALAYRQLSKQTPELTDLGIGSPYIAPSSGVLSFAGMQPNPIIPSIQSGPVIRPRGGIQPSQGIPTKATLAATAGPAPSIQREGKKKGDNSVVFWFAALIILSTAFVAGIGYRLWSRSKSKATVSSKGAAVSSKNTAVSLKDAIVSSKKVALKGILYSEDKPSALIGDTIAAEGDIINGVKVVKINRDTVEFEKDGERWTQHTK